MDERVKDINIKDEVPAAGKEDWQRMDVDVNEIELDDENPRLNLSTNPSQIDIIRALFEIADIDKLINSILEYKGLRPGENVILIKEYDKYKVIEGNRRVCALKCILQPDLIPKDKRHELRTMIKNSEIKSEELEKVDAEISPNRDDAQQIITARHSQYEILQWNYIQKWRRDFTTFKERKSIEATCDYLGETINLVRRNLKNYSFLLYVFDIPNWDESEIKQLRKNNLQGSVIEWHMSSIQDILKITFDNDYNLQSAIEKEKLDFVLEKLIRSFYLNGEPKLNTRTDKKTFRNILNGWMQEYDNKISPGLDKPTSIIPEGTIPKPKRKKKVTKNKKPDTYFESLYEEITVSEPRLKQLTYELSNANMKDRPVTGILLARSLIESALFYRIDKKGLTEILKNENKKDLKYIMLNKVLTFCIDHISELFAEQDYAKQSLEKIKRDHIKYMNSIVHNTWLSPTEMEVGSIAGDTRKLLTIILTDSP